MSYAFFNRDYILNCGEQNFSPAHFSAVLSLCRRYCLGFSLTVPQGESPLVEALRPYRTEPVLPAPGVTGYCYTLCRDTAAILENQVSDFFGFQSRGETLMPEDPTFYRADGSIFLDCCAHEGEVFLYPEPREDISSVLAYGGWIEMVGGTVTSRGIPRTPAAEHLMPPKPSWNVREDPLYLLLMEVRRCPERYLERPAFSLLNACISGFLMGWATPLPGKTRQWPKLSHTPQWFVGCRLFILARCGETTDVSLPAAYRNSGLSDEAAFHRFFRDMDDYLQAC